MLPIHIDIGFLHLHYYEGVYFFIAILSAVVYFTYLAKRENIDLEVMYEASFISILSAIIMARLFSLVFWSPQLFLKNPLIFFKVWAGGVSVTGGVLGGLTAGYVYARIKKLHFFYHIKVFIPPIILAQIIGRFGCFLNGDAAGIPTDAPWGMIFNADSQAYMNITPGTVIHPTQLYEMFGNFILLFFIVFTGNIEWITKRRIVWYALGYSIVRFVVEFFRNDSNKWSWFPILTTGQIICIGGFLLGLFILIWSIIYPEKLEAKEENIARPQSKAK